jgi:site-specific DNA-methyltransferase (adenine-specific)
MTTKTKKNPWKHSATINGVSCQIAPSDCLEVMYNHVEPGSVDLCFIDPPFNLGQNYDPRNSKADKKKWDDFAAFTEQWIAAVARIIRPGGSVFVHCGDHFADFVGCKLKENDLIRINWIVWFYRFGQYRDTAFINAKAHLHYFISPEGKEPDQKRTWNVTEVLEPSERLLGGDKRIATAKHKGMRPFFDVWYGDGLCRVQGNNEERTNRPNQLPEGYLSRIIRAASNPGDLILDPMSGSFTTGVVAAALGRNFMGCEIVPEAAADGFKRIKKGPVRDVKGSLRQINSAIRSYPFTTRRGSKFLQS